MTIMTNGIVISLSIILVEMRIELGIESIDLRFHTRYQVVKQIFNFFPLINDFLPEVD